MPQVRSPALILHSFAYGDTSRILRILTPEFGLRSVIAKGARRPNSRFGALLEPFTEGEVHFHLREGAELFTLSGFSLARSRQAIGRDLAAFSGASLLAEVILRFGTEEPNPELYALTASSFDRLADARSAGAATALHAIWRLVSLLGYQPEMNECVRCGRAPGDAESTGFDAAAGGIVCATCQVTGRSVPPAVRFDIQRMSEQPSIDLPDRLSGHGPIVGQFLTAHLTSDRGLRSLPLFLSELGD